MAYHDVDGVQYWVCERENDLYMHRDPFKNAAERLARDVEIYLYRDVEPDGSANPLYQNPDFLAWAIARYDSCKTGSGHPWDSYEFSPDSAPLVPVAVKGTRNYDGQITYEAPPEGDA